MKKPITAPPPREVTPDGFKVYCAYDEIVEIDSLKPNPRNPNRHPEAQVKMLARIIGEQGWRAPITVSRRQRPRRGGGLYRPEIHRLRFKQPPD